MQQPPPMVQIEGKFVEVEVKTPPIPYPVASKWGGKMAPASGRLLSVSVLTEKQYRGVLTTFENSAGVDVVTAPGVVTTSGRKAQLSVEETRSVIYQDAPKLPRDTSPDADPSPRNRGRLPFPPGFLPDE